LTWQPGDFISAKTFMMKNCLSVALFILVGTSLSYSDTPITSTNEILVAACRMDDNYLQLPMNITVLLSKELSDLPAPRQPPGSLSSAAGTSGRPLPLYIRSFSEFVLDKISR